MFAVLYEPKNVAFPILLSERFLAKDCYFCGVNKWNLDVVHQSYIQSQICLFTLQKYSSEARGHVKSHDPFGYILQILTANEY